MHRAISIAAALRLPSHSNNTRNYKMDKLLASLSQFNRREQTTLLIGALLVAFYVLWMAVLSPLNSKREQLIKTTTNTQQSLGRVQVLARQFEQLAQQSNQASVANDNLSGLID